MSSKCGQSNLPAGFRYKDLEVIDGTPTVLKGHSHSVILCFCHACQEPRLIRYDVIPRRKQRNCGCWRRGEVGILHPHETFDVVEDLGLLSAGHTWLLRCKRCKQETRRVRRKLHLPCQPCRYLHEWKGSLRTLREVADEAGVSLEGLLRRRRRGEPLEAAARKRPPGPIYLFKNEWLVLSEVAERTGLKQDSLRYFLKKGYVIDTAVKCAQKATVKRKRETSWEVLEHLGPGESTARCRHCRAVTIIKNSDFTRRPCSTCQERSVVLKEVGERVNGLTITRAYKVRKNGRVFARYDVACNRCGATKSGTLTRITAYGCCSSKCRYAGKRRRFDLCGEQVTYHDLKKLFGVSSQLILKKENESMSLEEIIAKYAKPVEGRA